MVGVVSDLGQEEEGAADAEVGDEGGGEGRDDGDVCGESFGGRVYLCGGGEGAGGEGEGGGGLRGGKGRKGERSGG